MPDCEGQQLMPDCRLSKWLMPYLESGENKMEGGEGKRTMKAIEDEGRTAAKDDNGGGGGMTTMTKDKDCSGRGWLQRMMKDKDKGDRDNEDDGGR